MNFNIPRHPVTIELNGRTYSAIYWVAGKIITVATGSGGKSTQVGPNRPEDVAKRLLEQLARAGKA